MSLKIRLSRGGAKKNPFYRVVVANSYSPRDGRYIERIGSYNPMVPKDSKDRLVLDVDRAKYWLGVGAQPTDRVAKFLASAGLAEKQAIHKQSKQHLPKAKTQERLKAAAEAAAAAAAAAAAEAANAEAPAKEAEAASEAPTV